MARPQTISKNNLVPLIRARGPISSTDLAAMLKVNRTTIGRALRGFGGELLSLGNTRSTRYVLRRDVRGLGHRWPLYRIDAKGHAHEWAELEAIHDRSWIMRWAGEIPVWAREMMDSYGLFRGFPFFLHDMRPQGFLGRIFAHLHKQELQIPEDPRKWSDDDILVALIAKGDDLPGDLVIGDTSLSRSYKAVTKAGAWVAEARRMEEYPNRARAIMESEPGSSAGGEQPKFITKVERCDGSVRSAIVKFSLPLDQDHGSRWGDLLLAEFHAHEVLARTTYGNRPAELFDAGDRRFLEIPRFDRSGAEGRFGVVTLEALVASVLGRHASNWLDAASELGASGWIRAETLYEISVLHHFGELIGNSDMHHGNLAFFLTDERPLKLAPAYDMLPMLWAPGPQGERIDRNFSLTRPIPRHLAAWKEAAPMAIDFWERVTNDVRVTPEFAAIARDAGQKVRLGLQQWG